MPFDSLTLGSVVSELNKSIISGRIANIVQLSPFDIILRIISLEKAYNLLISINPVYARIHLVSECPKSKKRWHFADFLQNHIKDGEIMAIEQINFDRIVRIHIIPQKEIISPAPKILVGEFMGKHSNLIILDENNRILESMKHVDSDISRYRQVLPDLDYIMPPANQGIDPFSADERTISDIIVSGSEPIWKKLLKGFQGMSPPLAKEIVARAANESPESIKKSFLDVMDYVKTGLTKPTVIFDNDKGEVIDVASIDLHQFKGKKSINFDSISKALEFYFQKVIERDSLINEKSSIIQAIKKKYEALREKHDSLQKQLVLAENAEELKLKGDLLIGNLQNLQRGQKETILRNFYDPNGREVSIQLDEKISPSDNAQKYYDEYKKAKRSKDVLEKLIRKNQLEMEFMEKAIREVEDAKDLDTLDNIREQLAKRGIVKEKSEIPRKTKEDIPLFRRFTSSDGFQIYLGRNDKENDLLVRGESSKSDMWLHAKQIEGSHVLIKNPDRKPDIPKRTLLESAIIAAKFSKAKHSTIVPVDYTWAKYVHKPKGGKPGFVIYTHEKTLFVSPSDFDSLFQTKVDDLSDSG